MSRFLKKLTFLFIFPLLLFFACLEVMLRNIPNDYSFKRKWLDTNGKQIKLLVLGSSTGYYGVNPSFLSGKAFNAAHIYQNPKYDLFILDKFISSLDSLQYIILPVTYHSFFYSLETSDENWRTKNYYIHYGMKGNRFDPKLNLAFYDHSLLSILKRTFRYYIKGQDEINCNAPGFGTSYLLERRLPNWEGEGEIKAKVHSALFNQEDYSENLMMLERMAGLCKERKIKLIMVFAPAWDTYIEHIDPELLKLDLLNCDEISRKYGNVSFVNMLNDKRFTNDDFYDVNHLNEFGSRKFTLAIDSIINSYPLPD